MISEDSVADSNWTLSAWSITRKTNPKRQSLEPLTTSDIAQVLRKGDLQSLVDMADGRVSARRMSAFLENYDVQSQYSVEQAIAEGPHWVVARVKRRRDGKHLLIKKITKAGIPQQQQYHHPCENSLKCNCLKCRPWDTSRPPIELVLLHSKDSGLPQLVECIEDEKYYYVITKMHGPSKKQWKHVGSWFGKGRWSTVYWAEFLS